MKRVSHFQPVRGVFFTFLAAFWFAFVVCMVAVAEEGWESFCDGNHCWSWPAGDEFAEATHKNSARAYSIESRLAAEGDVALIERELASLDTWTLSDILKSIVVPMAFDELAEAESSILLEVIRTREIVFSRIVELLADDRPFGELVLGREEWQRLRAAGEEIATEDWKTEPVGVDMLGSVLSLVSPEQAGRLLTMLTAESRFGHLSERLAELVDATWVHDVVELPEGWARKRVEAGYTFWLPLLVAEGNVDQSPALMEHVSQFPVERKLSIISQRPDPGFLPMLVDIHHSVLDELSCSDCAVDLGNSDRAGSLAIALASMGMPETIGMLRELIDAAPDARRIALAKTGLGLIPDIHGEGPFGLLRHSSREARDAIREVLTSYPDIPLDMWDVRRLEHGGVSGVRDMLEVRAQGMMDEVLSMSLESEEDARTWCRLVSVLIVAHDRGSFNLWPELDAIASKAVSDGNGYVECNGELYDSAVVGSHRDGLQVYLGLLERFPDETKYYEGLVDGALSFLDGDAEVRRAVLFDYLSGSELWDELEPRTQDRLLGLPDARASNCQAPADRAPEEAVEAIVD